MKKRKFSLKDKEFPLPAIITALPALFLFLEEEGWHFIGFLVLTGLALLVWGFIGPKLEPPFVGDPEQSPSTDTRRYATAEAQALAENFLMWGWTKRLYGDFKYRARTIALGLLLVAGCTGLLAYFSEGVLLRRANILIALCALGLLALAIAALSRKLRRRKENKDRAAYPTPQVNMSYDHDAAADARVRALQQRLERLDEWLADGMIGKEEYETLRKKYLGQ